MTGESVLQALRDALGEALSQPEVRVRTVGVARPKEIAEVWAGLTRETLPAAVSALVSLGAAHLSVISGRDAGEEIQLLYHLAVGYGTEGGEVMVTLRLSVPKSDLSVPSLCELIPGAETTEREKREFLGVEFAGISDSRNLFLPEDMTAHPWRQDDEQMTDLVRRTVKWEEGDGGA
ncbi:MAG: NADH-quinone oxidoreductase subunit C [Candidatus Bipolaricaulota bacterium]